jgi:hypothetical protein
MRTFFLTLLCCATIAGSCKKSTSPSTGIDGVYKGTFERQLPGGTTTSNVTIIFSDNVWKGVSSNEHFPALCNGSFQVDTLRATVRFKNDCVWTANFDGTLILNNEFAIIQHTGNYLELQKIYWGIVGVPQNDVYKLIKQ